MENAIVVAHGVSRFRLITMCAFWRKIIHSLKLAVTCVDIHMGFFGSWAVGICSACILPRKCLLICVMVAAWFRHLISVSRVEDVVCCFHMIFSIFVVPT